MEELLIAIFVWLVGGIPCWRYIAKQKNKHILILLALILLGVFSFVGGYLCYLFFEIMHSHSDHSGYYFNIFLISFPLFIFSFRLSSISSKNEELSIKSLIFIAILNGVAISFIPLLFAISLT